MIDVLSSEAEFMRLRAYLVGTIFPANHDAIIVAWRNLTKRLQHAGRILTVVECEAPIVSLEQQKEAAERKATAEASVVQNVFALKHGIPNSAEIATMRTANKKIMMEDVHEIKVGELSKRNHPAAFRDDIDLGDSRDTIPQPDEL